MEGKKRFAPELVSTSHISSWEVNQKPEQVTSISNGASAQSSEQDVKPKPRRFAPQLVDESEKSTRSAPEQSEQKPKPRRFAPLLVDESEASTKRPRQETPEQHEKPKPRRFAPQLVDESTQSSKGPTKPDSSAQDAKPKPRRFAPQLVDESEESSKAKSQLGSTHHVKFKPEPVATTYGSNRRGRRRDVQTSSLPDEEKPPPRKFAPILLDTARRSRRAGDPNAPIAQDYRTEYGYHIHAREHWRRLQGEKTPVARSENEMDEDTAQEETPVSPTSDDSQRLRAPAPLDGSAPARPTCLVPNRTHSFRMPSLDTIESSESEDDSIISSVPPTPRQEGSPIAVKTDSFELFKHATKRRESIDDDWQHYLLDLERKKAQERLEEQALAAYPNADFGYQHANHYFIDDDADDEFEVEERPVTWEGNDDDLLEMARRESAVNIPFEQREMQRYAEENQQERNAAKPTAKQPPTQSPFVKDLGVLPDAVDTEMKSMRDRARPPMLGNDIVFPRCKSPDSARFDVTQSSTVLKNQMCYLTATAEAERKRSGEEGGLWAAPKPKEGLKSPASPVSTTKSPVSAKATSPAKGLWGGFCVTDGEQTPTSPGAGMWKPQQPTGLMTPKQEGPNPFQLSLADGRPVGLMTPDSLPEKTVPGKKLRHRTDLEQLDAKLVTEREIDAMMEREYPDSFVTQVYNYLSLGYPSLARPFDQELSKISRISIAELRHDDEIAKATPRGYIRLGPDFEGGGGEGLTEDNCMRWQALKRYVREWARQEKNMVKSDGHGGNWATTARRGSWGI